MKYSLAGLLACGCVMVQCSTMPVSETVGMISFGQHVDNAWIEREVDLGKTVQPVLGLKSSNQVVILGLYQHESTQIARLSTFTNGVETVLWEWQDGGAIVSTVPRPQLYVCDLDGNGTEDIVFTYAINEAGGTGNERWQQHMKIYFDGGATHKTAIELSGMDVSYLHASDETEKVTSSVDYNNPGQMTDAMAFIFPSNGQSAGRIIVQHQRWTQSSIHETKDNQQPDSTTTEYVFHNRKAVEQVTHKASIEQVLRTSAPGVGLILKD